MFIKKSILLFTLVISFFITSCKKEEILIKVDNQRCENIINPLGIDVLKPYLGWKLVSTYRNKKQSAYQILVSDSEQALEKNIGNLWDTKKRNSDKSIQILYEGKTLLSEMLCFWKVRVWDESGNVSDWSKPAWWEMGLLNKSDWKAEWINDGKLNPQNLEEFYKDDPAPLFRRDFNVDNKIVKARLYITGLGYYEATINGSTVGDHLLDPGWTNYKKRVLYSTFDVTDLIKTGGNSIGVTLGNGWYNPLPMTMWGYLNLREHLTIGRPQFIAQLKIEYADNSSQLIVSNENWKTHEGPIIRNNIYLGEIYDARKEISGWDIFGFNDNNWSEVKKTTEKLGRLQAQNQPPIKITAKLKPVRLTEPKPNVYIFDMGQNYSGWVKLKVEAPAGTRIELRYGELLNGDGTINVMTSVAGQIKGKNKDGNLIGGAFSPDTAWQTDIYITKGNGIEYYTPRFTFHAFRYVEITGFPGKPTIDALQGLRLNSNLDKVGSFYCSNKLFNKIQKITEWTFLSNVFSVQSDCPHRERFCYGGDIATTTDAFIYNYDMSNFYAKVVRDFADAAHSNGMLTDTAPFVGIEFCGIGWAMAHPLLLLELYQYYGNITLIEEQYEIAKKWFELVNSENDLIIKSGLSDHESLAPIPIPEMVTPLYYQSATIMAKLAKIINQEEDAENYKLLSEQIKDAYLNKFLVKGTGRFAHVTQASQSFALYTGIAPEHEVNNAVFELVRNIEENKGHLTTGIFGTKYTLEVLSKYGYANKASQMVSQKSFPGWGNMLETGATTLWEHWKFSDNTFSHNHPMFGSVSEWFYKWVAGIQADPTAVGFNKIIIRPQIISNVDWVKAFYNSMYGKIISEWKLEGKSFSLEVTIPVNTSAIIGLPFKDITEIMEGERNIKKVKDIEFVKVENGFAFYAVGSGSYLFESEIK